MKADKIHRFLINSTVLAITSYFMIKKSTGFSFSDQLEAIFQPAIADGILIFMYVLIWYAIVARFVLYIYDEFKAEPHSTLSSPQQRCLLKCNAEIDKHLKELFDGKFDLQSMVQKHTYEENLQALHQNLTDHLSSALKKEKLPAENIFISVFHDPTFSPEIADIDRLEYVSHYDPTIHDTNTQTLSLCDDSTKGFAGIKALKQNKPVLCSSKGRGQYVIGSAERRESVKHYIGVPLHIMKKPVALLNIEFHNKQYFKSTRELKDFFKREVQAFVYMYEYQLHKKYFFHHLNEKVAS